MFQDNKAYFKHSWVLPLLDFTAIETTIQRTGNSIIDSLLIYFMAVSHTQCFKRRYPFQRIRW